ncbi:MAG: hypothetical protein HQM10_10610 [Candidatus Riflebacteria bacterium]|nr:hypothetical protein [Candidatus Riflebacteria bacterium]
MSFCSKSLTVLVFILLTFFCVSNTVVFGEELEKTVSQGLTIPETMFMEIDLKEKSDTTYKLSVNLKSLVGQLSDVKLSFNVSESYEITPGTLELSSLEEGKAKEVTFELKRNKPVSAEERVVVSVVASYVPDYQSMIKTISSDKVNYPDKQLSDSSIEYLQKKMKRTDSFSTARRFLLSE